MSGKYLHAITQRSTHQLSVAITTIERIAWPGDVDGDGGDTAEVSRLIVAPAAAMQSAIVDGRGGHNEDGGGGIGGKRDEWRIIWREDKRLSENNIRVVLPDISCSRSNDVTQKFGWCDSRVIPEASDLQNSASRLQKRADSRTIFVEFLVDLTARFCSRLAGCAHRHRPQTACRPRGPHQHQHHSG